MSEMSDRQAFLIRQRTRKATRRVRAVVVPVVSILAGLAGLLASGVVVCVFLGFLAVACSIDAVYRVFLPQKSPDNLWNYPFEDDHSW